MQGLTPLRDAGGFGLVKAEEYTSMFGDSPLEANVHGPLQLISHVPVGAFVGFVHRDSHALRHVMIHTGEGGMRQQE